MAVEHLIENEKRTRAPDPAVTQFAVTGMTCGNCARHVTEAIQSVPGVRSAAVNLEHAQAAVRWVAGVARELPAIERGVGDAGYQAQVKEATAPASGVSALSGWRLTLWIGVLGTAPLMFGEWVLGLGMRSSFQWFSVAVEAIVQVFAGAGFYRGAWNHPKTGGSNMDTLVALGSTTAFVYSAWALLTGQGGHLYFMEAAAIITLISAGHWVESRVSSRASGALRKLLELAPQTARKLDPSGTALEVSVAGLAAGDVVELRPGDRVPTDGQIVEGRSAVDESTLTGESAPVDKNSGDLLYAGTVNLNGRLLMRVAATGGDTALAHIIAAVERAQTSRANIQRIGDRVSSVFVPVVVVVALLAGLWWGLAPESARHVHDWLAGFLWVAHPPQPAHAAAVIIAAAVLHVAFPWAPGPGTPTADLAAAQAA